MDTKVLAVMEEAFRAELALAGDNLGVLEAVVNEKLRLLGQGLLQRQLDKQAHGYQGSSLACGCGGELRFVQHRWREIHTLFGMVTVRRAYYHCRRCGAGRVPYDTASGLGAVASQATSAAHRQASVSLRWAL